MNVNGLISLVHLVCAHKIASMCPPYERVLNIQQEKVEDFSIKEP